ncbi:hypothetical protein ACJJTC_013284 [Scirpophaga incertulas]
MVRRLCAVGAILCFLNLVLKVRDVVAVTKENPRVCIVGAGYSGLGAARYLKDYGVDNFKIFEATKHIGGTWRFDPHVGTDEDGMPLFTSMYENLRLNTPKLTMEYVGYPFPEGSQSFPTGVCFHKYLKRFAKDFDLIKHIQVDTKETRTEDCDFVVISNGEFSSPVWPKFEGLKLFKGKIIHSHDYKDPEYYRNRRVLLVGAGPSGLDLAMHLSNVTAKLVHSHHLKYNQPFFSDTYVKKPDIRKFTSNGVYFQDNSFEQVDDVIFATGYDFSYPFLDKSTGITATGKFVLPLYQHTVNIRHPTMMFVGVLQKVFNCVKEAQGEYAAALIAGKFKLPSQEQMLKVWMTHVHDVMAKGSSIIDVNDIPDSTGMYYYFGNLTAEAGIYRRPKVFSAIRDHTVQFRLENLLTFRDYDYKIIDEEHFVKWYNPRPGNPCPFDE